VIAAGKTLRRSCCRRYSVIPMRVRIRRSGTDWHRASIENQATDTFAAAAASRSDHDDLAARRRDARESPNVRTVRHDKKDSAPGPFVDDRARAGDQRLSLIAQHDHIAKCRLGFDRPQFQQRCCVHAAAPRRAEDSFDCNPFRPEPRADPCGVRASLCAEIALSGAVIDPEARRVAGATRRIGMAHQGDMPACVQRGPGLVALAMSAAVPKPRRIAKMAKRMPHMAAEPVKNTRSGARRRRR
jgi:hypothetical protein